MDMITILRELVRLRRYLIGVAVLAVLVGAMIMFQLPQLSPRQYNVGYATAQMLVDTPSSQVVDVAPKGSDSLGLRANLLASLLVDGVVKTQIARYAGVQPNQLGGVTDAATVPTSGAGSSAPLASGATPGGPEAYILTTHVLTDAMNNPLPIIEIDAQAPNRAAAARLAEATINGLRDYLNSTAAVQNIPDAQRLQVTGLGVPAVSIQSRGPSPFIAVLAVVFSFLLGCVGLIAGSRLIRRWRAVAAGEREPGPAPVALRPDAAREVPAAAAGTAAGRPTTVVSEVIRPTEAVFDSRPAAAPSPALDVRRRFHDETGERRPERHPRLHAGNGDDPSNERKASPATKVSATPRPGLVWPPQAPTWHTAKSE